jgi:hypothetical protein
LRLPALALLVGLLGACDMVKEKFGGLTKDVFNLTEQLEAELGTPVRVKLTNGTDMALTLKDPGPGGIQRDFARSVAEFARVFYAKPAELKRITVNLTDAAGKNAAPFTWTVEELTRETAAADKARADAARADSIAKAPPPPTTKTKAAPGRTSPTKAPATKVPPAATKTPS